jgi:hypothetical protein
LQRFATTDEVAALVTFVASPLSSATNGALDLQAVSLLLWGEI